MIHNFFSAHNDRITNLLEMLKGVVDVLRVGLVARLVGDKVEICKVALQLPHLIDERIVLFLKLCVRFRVLVVLVCLAVHLVDLRR